MMNNDAKTSDEIEEYKKNIIGNIQLLIDQGFLQEAKNVLDEYEKVVKEDIEIYSARGIISIMEGNADEAESILNKGLLKDSNNADLLYNIAYLYREMGKISNCLYFYKKLYYFTEDIKTKTTLKKEIIELGGDLKIKVLVGSPIHQKPMILKEFLQSLKEVSTENLELDYFFVDDNEIQESSDLLINFSDIMGNVFIHKAEKKDKYYCDNNTHYWREDLIWKVADFKNIIINYAINNKYDYLFLVDSDLIINPFTIKHLINTGKDIISEIFWTNWQPNSPKLPQVWLKDTYTQYDIKRGEKISNVEMIRRHNNFINKLKNPGVYNVGGLGACTLISKYALDKGVNFNEIYNLSFWGEDRHFCIRAASLGIPLYVDTNYPSYHIYREEDLKGVMNYKTINAKNRQR